MYTTTPSPRPNRSVSLARGQPPPRLTGTSGRRARAAAHRRQPARPHGRRPRRRRRPPPRCPPAQRWRQRDALRSPRPRLGRAERCACAPHPARACKRTLTSLACSPRPHRKQSIRYSARTFAAGAAVAPGPRTHTLLAGNNAEGVEVLTHLVPTSAHVCAGKMHAWLACARARAVREKVIVSS